MKRKFIIALLSILILSLLMPIYVYADDLYEYNDTTTTSSRSTYGDFWSGQTFQSSIGFTLTSVSLYLKRYGDLGGITGYVSISDAFDGKPTGVALSTQSFTVIGIGTDSFEWVNIVLGTPVSIPADDSYCFYVYINGGDSTHKLYVNRSSSNAYANGNGCVSDNAGSTWSLNIVNPGTPDDFVFKLYGTPPSPSVTTNSATYITTTTATVSGEVTAINDTSITERGFVWDTSTHGDPGNTSPAVSDYAHFWFETGTYGLATFTHGLTGLTAGDTYYVRACAENENGDWGYGDEITFTTWESTDLVLLYQPDDIISGTTLPDESGNGNDGVITWGTNPVGVLTEGSAKSAKSAVSDPGAGAGQSLITNVPDPISGMYDEGSTGGIPIAPLIDPALIAVGIPLAVFWYPIAFAVAIILGFAGYKMTRSLMVQAAISAVIMACFCGGGLLGTGLLPYWTVLVFVMEAILLIIIQEKQHV